jgi:hypothetical protein
VADVVTEPSTAALVHGLLQLGRGMGLQVIAEGIEDLDQADWLLRHGCAMAQGFAFGRPAPLPTPAEMLIDEVTDAPAEDGVRDTAEELAGEHPALRPARPVEHETEDLTDVLDHEDGTGAADVLPFPVARRTEPAGDLVETPTGDLPDALPEDPADD